MPATAAPLPHVVVIGGGPAGMSAALWLDNLGVPVTLLEAEPRCGGMQNLNFLGNDWVLGHSGQNGPQLAEVFATHLAQHRQVQLRLAQRIVRIDSTPTGFSLRLQDGATQACRAIVLATGTRARAAEVVQEVPGFAACQAHFRYGPWAFAAPAYTAGTHVLVLGGGDNAYENARLLLDQGCRVTLLARATPRAQQLLRSQVESRAGFVLLSGVRLQRFAPATTGLVCSVFTGADEHLLEAAHVHVLTGYTPNTDFLRTTLAADAFARLRFDHEGYLLTDADGRTGCFGLYAAGDVCNPQYPSVVSALALGARAAKAIERDFRSSREQEE